MEDNPALEWVVSIPLIVRKEWALTTQLEANHPHLSHLHHHHQDKTVLSQDSPLVTKLPPTKVNSRVRPPILVVHITPVAALVAVEWDQQEVLQVKEPDLNIRVRLLMEEMNQTMQVTQKPMPIQEMLVHQVAQE